MTVGIWVHGKRVGLGAGTLHTPRAREAGRGDTGEVCRSGCSLRVHAYLKVTASSLCSSCC